MLSLDRRLRWNLCCLSTVGDQKAYWIWKWDSSFSWRSWFPALMKYWQPNLYSSNYQEATTKDKAGYYFLTHKRKCSYIYICAFFVPKIYLVSYIYLILYKHKSLFICCCVFFVLSVSHRPSSDPTQMLVPIPEGALWTPASASSLGEGSGTYSRHRTAAPTCRLFTALGMGLLRENISICPWEPSPPATCGEEKGKEKKKKHTVEKGWDPMLSCASGLNHNARGNKLFCWNWKKRDVGRAKSKTRTVSLKSCLQCVLRPNQAVEAGWQCVFTCQKFRFRSEKFKSIILPDLVIHSPGSLFFFFNIA